MSNNSKKIRVICNDLLLTEDKMRSYFDQSIQVDFIKPEYDVLCDCIAKYDAYFASVMVQADQLLLQKANNLKVIATPSTGTDHIDRKFAEQNNITILDIKTEYELLDSFSATAEMSWCLLLALIRNLPQAFNSVKEGNWARHIYSGHQLLNKTIGILGYGRLGKMMARIAKGFRMNVLACDIKPFEAEGVTFVDFDTLLSESDIISIHIHLTDETKNMFSFKEFSKMKSGVILINTSRGAIINEQALLDSLISGRVGGAGLDIICGEWNTDLKQHPLIQYANQHSNLLISPHIGGATVESIEGARIFTAKKLADYLRKGV